MNIRNRFSAFLTATVLLLGMAIPASLEAKATYVPKKARVSVHDPSVMYDAKSGLYYIFGSHIEAARSADLQSWQTFSNGYATNNNALFGSLSQNLQKAFAWAGENLEDCVGGFAVWAPDVIYNPEYRNADGSKGAYMMYFCTSSTYKRSVIAYGVSQTVEGPYTFVDTLIYSGFTDNDSYATSSTKNVNRKYTSTNIDELIAAGQVTYNEAWFQNHDFNNRMYPNAIDPNIYYGTDGKMYLSYGSWSGGIFVLELDQATGRCIHPKTGTTPDGRMVDSYFGTKISGGYGKSGEGPFIEYHEETGFYYLWVTYGGLTSNGGYNMRVFRATEPLGPYLDAAGRNAVLASDTNLNSIGTKVMNNYQFSGMQTAYMAPGHNSVLKDDSGWYLVYHTRFDDGYEYHEVRVHAMTFNEAGWPVVSPFEYSGDPWSQYGFEASALAGDYAFIDHGTGTDANISRSSMITLRADGTIGGDVSGTWSLSKENAYADFVIGGVNYHGVFAVQHDESGSDRKVMTFTAIGNNNHTIWGAQNTPWSGTERQPDQDYTGTSPLVYHLDSVQHTEGDTTLCGTDLPSGIPYFITNVHSGKVIDLSEGNTAGGTNVQQWTKTGGSQQEWRVLDLGNGYCKILSMADETMCLTVQGSSGDNGLNVVLEKDAGTENQQWKLMRNGGFYGIVSRCSGDAAGLDVYEWSKENGGNVNQWEYWGGECQLWRMEPVYAVAEEGNYTIRNLHSGFWLGDSENGLVQNTEHQIWKLYRNDNGSYSIVDGGLQAITCCEEGSTWPLDGSTYTLMPYDPNNSLQQFRLQCNVDGSYSFLWDRDDATYCIGIYGEGNALGERLSVWGFYNIPSQRFILEPTAQEPEPPPVTVIKGDVNCDSMVKIDDVVLLCRYLGEDATVTIQPQGLLNADCDGDGKSTPDDSILILKYLAQLITHL